MLEINFLFVNRMNTTILIILPHRAVLWAHTLPLDQLMSIYHGALCFHIPLKAIIALDLFYSPSQGYGYRYLSQGTGKEPELRRVEFGRSPCWSLLLTAVAPWGTGREGLLPPRNCSQHTWQRVSQVSIY